MHVGPRRKVEKIEGWNIEPSACHLFVFTLRLCWARVPVELNQRSSLWGRWWRVYSKMKVILRVPLPAHLYTDRRVKYERAWVCRVTLDWVRSQRDMTTRQTGSKQSSQTCWRLQEMLWVIRKWTQESGEGWTLQVQKLGNTWRRWRRESHTKTLFPWGENHILTYPAATAWVSSKTHSLVCILMKLK